jgi:SPP1 family predicted phage head-tail adaptor
MKINLDNLIEIQTQVTSTSSTSGRPKGNWVTTSEVWAEVQDSLPSRDEGIASGSVEVAKYRARIRIRWDPEITGANRIKVSNPKARTLQSIGGPADINGRKAFMELMCEEVTSA